jgi:molybdate transport system regulatory protein
MARLYIRIDLSPTRAIGPGKIKLLELIEKTGSISAAGREMDMSYRRAWMLVDDLNNLFERRVVDAKVGGKIGGGATLTEFGRALVRHYREMEASAHGAVAAHLRAIEAAGTGDGRAASRRGKRG